MMQAALVTILAFARPCIVSGQNLDEAINIDENEVATSTPTPGIDRLAQLEPQEQIKKMPKSRGRSHKSLQKPKKCSKDSYNKDLSQLERDAEFQVPEAQLQEGEEHRQVSTTQQEAPPHHNEDAVRPKALGPSDAAASAEVAQDVAPHATTHAAEPAHEVKNPTPASRDAHDELYSNLVEVEEEDHSDEGDRHMANSRRHGTKEFLDKKKFEKEEKAKGKDSSCIGSKGCKGTYKGKTSCRCDNCPLLRCWGGCYWDEESHYADKCRDSSEKPKESKEEKEKEKKRNKEEREKKKKEKVKKKKT